MFILQVHGKQINCVSSIRQLTSSLLSPSTRARRAKCTSIAEAEHLQATQTNILPTLGNKMKVLLHGEHQLSCPNERAREIGQKPIYPRREILPARLASILLMRIIMKGKIPRETNKPHSAGLEILLPPMTSAIIGVATYEVLYFSSTRWPPRVPVAPYQPQSLEEVQAMNQRPKRGFPGVKALRSLSRVKTYISTP